MSQHHHQWLWRWLYRRQELIKILVAIGLIQLWVLSNIVFVRQQLQGPTSEELITTFLEDRRADPASNAMTSLDQELARQFREPCVEIGETHRERTLPAPTRCLSRYEIQEILLRLVLTTSAVFTQHNITHFLDSGTLLGAVRHKSIIPYDQDADMGITSEGLARLRSSAILFPSDFVLYVHGSWLHPQGSRYPELPVRVVHRASTLYVDVFVFLDSVDSDGLEWIGPVPSGAFVNCVGCPSKEFKVPRAWVFPLGHCRFAGYDLPCPRDTDQYLRHMFGPDYWEPIVFPY